MAHIPQCDRCETANVQVVPVLGRDLCGRCCQEFVAWVNAPVKPAPATTTVEFIQQIVAEYHSVTVAEMLARDRRRAVIVPRMVAIYLCRNLLGMSLPEIGRRFGLDHSTVMHSVAKVRGLLDADDQRTAMAIAVLSERARSAGA